MIDRLLVSHRIGIIRYIHFFARYLGYRIHLFSIPRVTKMGGCWNKIGKKVIDNRFALLILFLIDTVNVSVLIGFSILALLKKASSYKSENL